MTSKKSLWEILVPECSKEGIKYSVDFHRGWDNQVRSIAGGITILKRAKGHWLNPHSREFLEEEMIPVRIYCTEDTIDKIIEYTIQYYDQEAVLAYEISSNVKLKSMEGGSAK
ncbi:hypothetical protein HYS50_03940 [Candidatus Woesearchaeota archaeon]|nr:hypothetical protein [Candidatus Woesearchaeota archaeon]